MLSTAVLVGMIGFWAAVTLGFGSTAAVKVYIRGARHDGVAPLGSLYV